VEAERRAQGQREQVAVLLRNIDLALPLTPLLPECAGEDPYRADGFVHFPVDIGVSCARLSGVPRGVDTSTVAHATTTTTAEEEMDCPALLVFDEDSLTDPMVLPCNVPCRSVQRSRTMWDVVNVLLFVLSVVSVAMCVFTLVSYLLSGLFQQYPGVLAFNLVIATSFLAIAFLVGVAEEGKVGLVCWLYVALCRERRPCEENEELSVVYKAWRSPACVQLALLGC
jgi:hypothetical protein